MRKNFVKAGIGVSEPISKMHLGSKRRISAKSSSRDSSYLWYESPLRQRLCDEIRSLFPSKPFLRWILAIAIVALSGIRSARAQESLVILNTAIQFVSESAVVIRWDTNAPSTSEVEYGLTTAYGQTTGHDTVRTAVHTVPLGGLTAGVPYHFRVKSESVAGALVVSRDYTLTTKADSSSGTVSSSPAQLGAGGTSRVSKVFTRDLAVGMRGDDVTALQRFLIEQKQYPEALVTGYFGTLTRAAVARFQQAQGIAPALGYFGPITRARVATLGGGM